MKILDHNQSLAALAELPIVRLAGYDAERAATYAVPLAFALLDGAAVIAIAAQGRLARLLRAQRHGICLEADEVAADLSFRSVIGSVRAEEQAEATPALVALAARYGAEWGRWRPSGEVAAFRLDFTVLQGREKG